MSGGTEAAPGRDPFRCQCKRWREACASRMTGEDLLCGACRNGCNAVLMETDGKPSRHVVAGSIVFLASTLIA